MEKLIVVLPGPITRSIALANGRTTTPEKLEAHFKTLHDAEDSGQDYPVDFDHAWPIGFSRKDVGVRALLSQFVENVDYQVFHQIAENSQGGRPKAVYKLSLSCFEYFSVRANQEVFDVYRTFRKAIRQISQLQAPPVPQDLPTALRLAADLAEQKAALQQQVEEAKPKVAFFDAVAVAKNSVPMATAAKVLKMKGVGRNKLFQMLKADNILQANNETLQRYIDAGYFEVEPQPYLAGKNGEKGPRIGCTTRVTGHGLEWLTQKYKAA